MNKKSNMKRSVLALLSVLSLSVGGAQADTQVRTTSYEYTAQGLLSKEVQEPNTPNSCLQTSYTYDSFGNRTGSSATVCSGATGNTILSAGTARTSSASFGTDGRFPISATNALLQSESRVFDARFGGLTTLTGPNSLPTNWIYDSWGRKTRETRADETYTTWSYKLCSESGANCPSSVGPATVAWVAIEQSYAKNAAISAPEKRTFYDTLNRQVRSQTQGFDGGGTGATLYQDTEYNAQGQVARQSRIYASTDSPMWTSFEYDAVGRVVSESHPDAGGVAQTTYAHSALTTTRTRTVAALSTDIQGGQWAAPTITASQGPSPWVGFEPATLSWSSTNASTVTYKCTSSGAGFTANQTVAPNGTTPSFLVSDAWAGIPSTCVFTAAGPGGTATYNLAVNTLPALRQARTVNVGTQNNYVASTSKVTNYLAGKTDVTFNITGAVGSAATSIAAFSVDSSWAAGDTVKITVNSGAGIYGAGGTGGAPGFGVTDTANGTAGGSGGPALKVVRQVEVVNSGTIGGGGGGGGGGAGGSTLHTSGWFDSWWSSNYHGGGGGGGQGVNPGLPGGLSTAYPGSTGSQTQPGAGGSGYKSSSSNSTIVISSGAGGMGGGLGGNGASGGSSENWSNGWSPGGAGGVGGAAVVGNSFVTWTVVGTRLGALQ